MTAVVRTETVAVVGFHLLSLIELLVSEKTKKITENEQVTWRLQHE